jgi:hypothetical protein
MKRRPFKIAGLLILVLSGLSSCYTVSPYYLSILEPADVTLPQEIHNISICRGPLAVRPVKGELDSLDNIRLNPDVNYYGQSVEYLYGLADVLTNSPRFDRIVVHDSAYTGTSGPERPSGTDSLTWNDVVRICRQDSTDALVRLEYFYLTDFLEITRMFDLECSVEYGIINFSVWKVYAARVFEIADECTLVDTLIWTVYDFYCESALRKFAKTNVLVGGSFYWAGNRYGQKISPSWKDSVKRSYYSSGNRHLREADDFVKSNRWSDAIELWRSLTEHKDKLLASRACFNMALACEMEDKPALALEWARKSASLYHHPATAAYIKKLEKRLIDREKLNRQIHNN